MIDDNARLTPSDEAIDSIVGDETVILHLDSCAYYGLDPIGTLIWEGLKAGEKLASIRDSILAGYEVTAEVAEADMQRFLQDLIDHGMLVAG